ncbi:MAG: EamA family transporter [Bacillota bacterium]
MSWIPVAIAAYFLLAISNLIDKFLVEKVIGSGRAYAFVACILGSVVFIGAPWLLSWPGIAGLALDLLLGAIFCLALLLLFASLRRGEASRALVIVGGSTPVFTIPLSLLILGERFPASELTAVLLLVIGVAVVALLPRKQPGFWTKVVGFTFSPKTTISSVILALGSGLAYSLFFVGSKLAYQQQPFLSAFLWMRLAAAVAALFILLSPKARAEIKSLFQKKPGKKKNQVLVVGNQILGAGGFVLQNYAIYLGPVTLVNALQGVQYAWVILIGAVVTFFKADILREDIGARALIQKGFAILMIGAGLYLLSI